LFLSGILGNATCIKFANKFGRKEILCNNFLLIGVMSGLYSFSYMFDHTFWLRVMILFVISFSIGFGILPMFWIVIADYLPVKAISKALILFNVLMFLAGYLFPLGMENIGLQGNFLVICFFQISSWLITKKIFVESKNKTQV
jgi:MFS family permease